MFSASKVVPWLEAPSPEKATATLPLPSFLAASAAPTTSGGAAADDGVRAEHPLVEIGDVHRAALAVAQPALLAGNLLHHPAESQPLAMQWPWPRWVLAMRSSSVR